MNWCRTLALFKGAGFLSPRLRVAQGRQIRTVHKSREECGTRVSEVDRFATKPSLANIGQKIAGEDFALVENMLRFHAGHAMRKTFPTENFPAAWLFYPGAQIKTLCFQRLVFGLPRASNSNRRREDAPRIPLGD